MRIKRYVVNKLEEARNQIVRDLGKDAIILHTNRVRASGIKGFFGKHYVEVLAASDEKEEKSQRIKEEPAENTEPINSVKEDNKSQMELDEIKRELQENRKLLNNVLTDLDHVSTQFPPQYNKYFKLLVTQGVTHEKAKKIITKLRGKTPNSTKKLDENLREIMLQEIEPILSKGIHPKDNASIGLVGPTGVGKTTTIAKLAAHASLNEKMTIGLITLDNFRVAAAEQLKVYGEILDVPVLTANNLKEYQEALKKLKSKDRIYVDTAGRSHKNVAELEEIKGYFDKLSLDYIYLSISVTTNFEDLIPTLDTYAIFNPVGLIITKLDEVDRYGNVYNIITHFKRPIFYFTTGQNVPDDIEVLSAETIVDKILGENHG